MRNPVVHIGENPLVPTLMDGDQTFMANSGEHMSMVIIHYLGTEIINGLKYQILPQYPLFYSEMLILAPVGHNSEALKDLDDVEVKGVRFEVDNVLADGTVTLRYVHKHRHD